MRGTDETSFPRAIVCPQLVKPLYFTILHIQEISEVDCRIELDSENSKYNLANTYNWYLS